MGPVPPFGGLGLIDQVLAYAHSVDDTTNDSVHLGDLDSVRTGAFGKKRISASPANITDRLRATPFPESVRLHSDFLHDPNGVDDTAFPGLLAIKLHSPMVEFGNTVIRRQMGVRGV